jgi:septum formation protein
MRLILASSSPRRKEILSLLGVAFEIVPPGVDEYSDSRWTVSEEAAYWALQKARAVVLRHPAATVIGSDTLIDLDGMKVGKPHTPEEALRTLRRLAGRSHRVVTAICLVMPGGKKWCDTAEVLVRMRPVPDEVLVRYASTDEPLDKAGGYSIQGEGRLLIDGIEGDYLAAVGLPLRSVAQGLREARIPVTADVERIYRERAFGNWKDFAL